MLREGLLALGGAEHLCSGWNGGSAKCSVATESGSDLMRWQRSLLGRQCNGGTTGSPELGARWVSFGYIEKPTLALACAHWGAGEADLTNKWAQVGPGGS